MSCWKVRASGTARRSSLNPPSPYARKVVLVAYEIGLADKIEIVKVDPWDDRPVLLDATPLWKVPALLTGDGSLIVESGTIAQYLVHQTGKPSPTDGTIDQPTDEERGDW